MPSDLAHTRWFPAAIALGSNVGDRAAHLDAAARALASHADVRVQAVSTPIETAAVPAPGSPPGSAGGAFLNAALVLTTTLNPRALLDVLHAIERSRGRLREPATTHPGLRDAPAPPAPLVWMPRTLDLDLLLYDDAIIRTPGLSVPHPRMHERPFVLDPLEQIAPHWVVPTLGLSVTQLVRRLRQAHRHNNGDNRPGARPPPCPTLSPPSALTRTTLLALLAVLSVFIAPTSVRAAQVGGPDAAQPASPPSTDDLLALARSAYAQSPTADRIAVSVRRPDGREARREILLALDPRPGEPAGPRLRLDLGDLHITAGDARFRAISDGNDQAVYEAPLPGPLTLSTLATMLPPLPLAPLALLEGPAGRPLTPYAGPGPWTWTMPTATPSQPASDVVYATLHAQAGPARITLTLRSDGRLRELIHDDLPGGTRVRLEFTPLPSPGPSVFALPTQGRTGVRTLSDLGRRTPRRIAPGAPAISWPVTSPDGSPTTITQTLDPPDPRPGPDSHARRMLLLAWRVPISPDDIREQASDVAALGAELATMLRERQRLRSTPRPTIDRPDSTPPDPLPPALSAAVVLIADVAEGNVVPRLRLGADALQGLSHPASAAHAPLALLTSSSPFATVDAVVGTTAPADLVLVMLDADARVLWADWIEPETTPTEFTARIRAALEPDHQPAGPPEP